MIKFFIENIKYLGKTAHLELNSKLKRILRCRPEIFIISRIINAVEILSENPVPTNCKKLIGSDHIYRIRVGDYRILYSIENDLLLIEIIRVGHRKDIYKKQR